MEGGEREGGEGGGLAIASRGILVSNLVVDETSLWEASWGLLPGLSGASWRYFWDLLGPLGGLLGVSWCEECSLCPSAAAKTADRPVHRK